MESLAQSLNAGAIAPEAAILIALVACLLADLAGEKTAARLVPPFCYAGLGVSLVLLALQWSEPTADAFFSSFITDNLGVAFRAVVATSTLLSLLISWRYVERAGTPVGEYAAILMAATVGAMLLCGATDLVSIFVALETLSVSSYLLSGYMKRDARSSEAALKYLLVGSAAAAVFLYGTSLLYGVSGGSTNLDAITIALQGSGVTPLSALALVFVLATVAFKISAVPFHQWTPDVYEGSPTPVVAFMASAVKAAGFAALVRVFVTTFADHADDWQPAVYGLAILTLVVGSFMAIVQRDAKRMLAYSSISHAGFILVGVQAASDEGISSVLFYAVAYTFLVIGSFGVLSIVSGEGDRGTSLDHLDGLSTRRPALALALTVFLLAQAGVPLTSGFVAKFAVIGAAVEARSYWLAIAAMVTAVVSAFLYLRIILSMYLGQAEDDAPTIRVPRAAGLAIIVAFVITVGFGLVPGELDDITRDAVPVLIAAG